MSDTWRLIDKGGLSARDCLTVPTALAKGVAAGQPDTLAVYFPLERFVSVGAEQEVRQAVDLAYCAAEKIPVWRRTTGGGALFVDSQQIFYSLARRLTEPLPNALDQLYNDWLQPLQRTCRQLNVPAQYQQYNRLQLGPYQIAGAVASLVDGVLLFTANLLVNVSQETVDRVLGITPGGGRGRRLTSMRHEYEGHGPPDEVEIRAELIRQFEGLLAIGFARGDLTESERAEATALRAQIQDEQWLYGVDERAAALRDRPQEDGVRVWRNQRRTEGGLLDLTLVTQNSCIKDIQFTGSPLFLQPDGLRQVENYLRGCFLSPAEVGERVVNLYHTLGLKSAGTTPADFLILVGDTIGRMAP
jgi:lipoate-protein ligase A